MCCILLLKRSHSICVTHIHSLCLSENTGEEIEERVSFPIDDAIKAVNSVMQGRQPLFGQVRLCLPYVWVHLASVKNLMMCVDRSTETNVLKIHPADIV